MRATLQIVTLLASLTSGCAVMTSSSTREVVVDAQFDAPTGTSFRLPGAAGSLGVVSVADSRCPTDVQCITAGDAVVVVLLDEGSASRTDTLRLRGTPRAVRYGPHRVELIDVRPYPVSTERDRVSIAVLRIAR